MFSLTLYYIYIYIYVCLVWLIGRSAVVALSPISSESSDLSEDT